MENNNTKSVVERGVYVNVERFSGSKCTSIGLVKGFFTVANEVDSCSEGMIFVWLKNSACLNLVLVLLSGAIL